MRVKSIGYARADIWHGFRFVAFTRAANSSFAGLEETEMTRIAVRLLVSLSASLFALAASAQDPREPDTCHSLSSASRTRASQCGEEEPTAEPVEKELTLTFDRPVLESAQCKATMNIEYLQIDTIARVTGVIGNEDCAASSGEYTIQARIRNESGETRKLDFTETWQRDDDQPVKVSAEYPIGENVELLRLRSSGLRCGSRVRTVLSRARSRPSEPGGGSGYRR